MLEGPYQWNFPSGHPQMKATFHADDFPGPITTYDEKGHTLLRLSYPRPFDMVVKAWQMLAPKERAQPEIPQGTPTLSRHTRRVKSRRNPSTLD